MNSNNLDQNGNATCNTCRKATSIQNLDTCVCCDKFVCSKCSSNSNTFPSGIKCKKCNNK